MNRHGGPGIWIRSTVGIILFVAAVFMTGPGEASAATFTVTNTNDSGYGSLRQAVIAVIGAQGGTINFAVSGTITLASEIVISENVTINGPGRDILQISGGGTNRVFKIENQAVVSIDNLTITNGFAGPSDFAGQGGAIAATDASLYLLGCTVSDSTGSYGGGIYISGGNLDIYACTIQNNSASLGGGLLVEQPGYFTVEYSTFSGNQGTLYGGGILTSSSLSIRNSTISNNLGGRGLAVLNNGAAFLRHVTIASNGGGNLLVSGSPASVTTANSLVASPVTGTNCTFWSGGTLTSEGHNLDSENSCMLNAAGDLVNAAPHIGPLAQNGGGTQTRALLSGSPAINTADALYCSSWDQRGVSRPQWGGCDIGAYEYEPVNYAIHTFPGASGTISCAPYESVASGSNPIYYVIEQSDPVCVVTPNIGYHVADVLAGPYGSPLSVGPVWTYGFPNIQENKTISASFASNTGSIWLFKGPGLPNNSSTTSINEAFTKAAADDDDEIRVHSGAYFEGLGLGATCSGNFGRTIPVLSGGWASFLGTDTKPTIIAPKLTISGACALEFDEITIQ